MRHYLDPRDHAFAHGPVFFRPSSREEARCWFDDPADGDRLFEVFERFAERAELGEGVRLGLEARIITAEADPAIRAVRIGAHSAIRGIVRCEPGARITIGEGVYIGDGVILSATNSIEIGDWSLLAHGAQVFDNDTHPLDPAEREAHFRVILGLEAPRPFDIGSAPVRIGPRCWLGFNSAVMKGVTLGEGVVVAASGMVVSDLPARSIAAGNPARVVKSL